MDRPAGGHVEVGARAATRGFRVTRTVRTLRTDARAFVRALRPRPVPDLRFEVVRRRDMRRFLSLFLLLQMAYALAGAATGGPGALASDPTIAFLAGVTFFMCGGLLFLAVRQARTLPLLELVGVMAGVVTLTESLFGQLHDPGTAAAVTTYEAIAVAASTFAIPWRVAWHWLWLALAAAFTVAGLFAAVGSPSERGALLGAFAFACAVAVIGKPLAWNGRVERHLETIQVRRLNVALRYTSRRDVSTGLETRRALQELLAHLARRSAGRIGFAMVDVDGFKAINDLDGHQAGDRALIQVAHELRAAVRDVDHVFRYGGEEFLVVLDRTDEIGPALVAERIRAGVERRAIPNRGSSHGVLTVSVGTAEVELPATPDELTDAIARADSNMYAAKQGGRNRVVAGDHEETDDRAVASAATGAPVETTDVAAPGA